MSLSVSDFRAAAQALGRNETLKLTDSGRHVATTTWQSFKVAVSDFFGGDAVAQAREQAAVRGFVEAVKREHGDAIGDMIAPMLGPPGSRLTGAAVEAAVHEIERLEFAAQLRQDHDPEIAEAMLGRIAPGPTPPTAKPGVLRSVGEIEARGGPTFLRNETLIQTIVGAPREGNAVGPLPTLVGPQPDGTVLEGVPDLARRLGEQVLQQAAALGLPETTLAAVRKDFLEAPPAGSGRVSGLASQIRDALEAAIARLPPEANGRLDPASAMRIAEATTTRLITEQVNTHLLYDHLSPPDGPATGRARVARETIHQAFQQHAAARGLGHLVDRLESSDAFSIGLGAVARHQGLIAPGDLPRLLEAAFDRQLERQAAKLERLAQLDLPDGPAAQRLAEALTGTRRDIPPGQFAVLLPSAQVVADGLAALRGEADPEARLGILERMGKDLALLVAPLDFEGTDERFDHVGYIGMVLASRHGDLLPPRGEDGEPPLSSEIGALADRLADEGRDGDGEGLQMLRAVLIDAGLSRGTATRDDG